VTHRFGSFPEWNSLDPKLSIFLFSFFLLKIGWGVVNADNDPKSTLPAVLRVCDFGAVRVHQRTRPSSRTKVHGGAATEGVRVKIAQQQKRIEALAATVQKVSEQLELNKTAPQTVLNNQ